MMSLLGIYIGYQIIEGITKGILMGAFVPCEQELRVVKLGEVYKGCIK